MAETTRSARRLIHRFGSKADISIRWRGSRGDAYAAVLASPPGLGELSARDPASA